jgi:non-ribosomal peptide synthetase component F
MISSQRQVSSHSDYRSVCVPESVAAMATKWPDAVALTAGSQVLTYRELDSQSNRLAQQLRSLGIGAGLAVGVCLPRSLELVVCASSRAGNQLGPGPATDSREGANRGYRCTGGRQPTGFPAASRNWVV